MPYAYGYARVSTQWPGQDDSNSLEVQQEVLPKVAAEKFPNHEYKGTAWDAQSASALPFASRKAGRTVAAVLERGDALLVTKGDRIFRNLRDYFCGVRLYSALGVTLFIHDIGLYVGSHERSPAALDPKVVARLKRQLASESTRCAIGYMHTRARFPHRPALGYLVNGWGNLIADTTFRRWVQHLYDARTRSGSTWHDLYLSCRYSRIAHPRGGEWTPPRLRRAFKAFETGWPCCEGWVPKEDRTFAPATNCAASSPDRR